MGNRLYGNIDSFCEKWIPYPPNFGQIISDMKFLQINAFVLPSYWKCSKKIKNKIKNPTSCVYKEMGTREGLDRPYPLLLGQKDQYFFKDINLSFLPHFS